MLCAERRRSGEHLLFRTQGRCHSRRSTASLSRAFGSQDLEGDADQVAFELRNLTLLSFLGDRGMHDLYGTTVPFEIPRTHCLGRSALQ
jgi:hypothetical protein